MELIFHFKKIFFLSLEEEDVPLWSPMKVSIHCIRKAIGKGFSAACLLCLSPVIEESVFTREDSSSTRLLLPS